MRLILIICLGVFAVACNQGESPSQTYTTDIEQPQAAPSATPSLFKNWRYVFGNLLDLDSLNFEGLKLGSNQLSKAISAPVLTCARYHQFGDCELQLWSAPISLECAQNVSIESKAFEIGKVLEQPIKTACAQEYATQDNRDRCKLSAMEACEKKALRTGRFTVKLENEALTVCQGLDCSEYR